jgi:hypothetical protein
MDRVDGKSLPEALHVPSDIECVAMIQASQHTWFARMHTCPSLVSRLSMKCSGAEMLSLDPMLWVQASTLTDHVLPCALTSESFR